jgi:hypothetical protein
MSAVQLEACIIVYGMDGVPFSGSVHTEGSATVTATSCDVWANNDGDYVQALAAQHHVRGNFTAHPCFCAGAIGDFTLSTGSYCLDVNHPWGWMQTVGAFGADCDRGTCGTVSGEARTWGSVKGLYR